MIRVCPEEIALCVGDRFNIETLDGILVEENEAKDSLIGTSTAEIVDAGRLNWVADSIVDKLDSKYVDEPKSGWSNDALETSCSNDLFVGVKDEYGCSKLGKIELFPVCVIALDCIVKRKRREADRKLLSDISGKAEAT